MTRRRQFLLVVLLLHVPLFGYPVLRLCGWLGLDAWSTTAVFLPAVEIDAAKSGLQCTVYASDAKNLHELIFAPETKPETVKTTVVPTPSAAPATLDENQVVEYKGYLDVTEDGFYQFVVTSAQKMDVRLDKVTLSLFDTTGLGKDKEQVRKYTGQVHLSKGKHAFSVYHYVSVPWTAFKLTDALGKDNEDEIKRKAAWEKEPKTFTPGYIKPEQSEVIALPADVFTCE